MDPGLGPGDGASLRSARSTLASASSKTMTFPSASALGNPSWGTGLVSSTRGASSTMGIDTSSGKLGCAMGAAGSNSLISACKRARSFGPATVVLPTAAEASPGPLNMVPNAPSMTAHAMLALPAATNLGRLSGGGG
eukprot:scaffold115762_cov60-Phaeocystis_antarctica.AAC.3